MSEVQTKYTQALELIKKGTTQRAACEKVGINTAAFWYWKNKEKKSPVKRRKKSKPEMIELNPISPPKRIRVTIFDCSTEELAAILRDAE